MMLGRLMLIWLVLLHAVAPAAFGAGVAGERLGRVLCAPEMSCVTEMGCCCEASPTEDQSQKQAPISASARGLELIPIPTPLVIAWGASDRIEYGALASAPRIEPAAQLRRLARMCVWRT